MRSGGDRGGPSAGWPAYPGRLGFWWLGLGLLLSLWPLIGIAAPPPPPTWSPLQGPLPMSDRCAALPPTSPQFTLVATGDTFPHEPIQVMARARGWDWTFDQLRPYLRGADLAYTNFDGAMLAGSRETGYPAFNFSPLLAPAMRRAGITVVSTANNHILDRGLPGLDATLSVLDSAGIQHHGAVPRAAVAQTRPPYIPLTLQRGAARLTVGFLSATWGTNGLPDPHGQINLLWADSNAYGSQGGPLRPELLAAVAQARRETDLVMVAAHWGMEYEALPRPFQREAARQLVAAGADLIVGAQPHTLQPVELIEAEGRQALVFYSLGNFLAAQGRLQSTVFANTSVILYVGVAVDADGRAHLSGYRYLPIVMSDGETRMAPVPPDQTRLIAHVRRNLRDPDGQLQLSADPAAIGAHLALCSNQAPLAPRPIPPRRVVIS